LRLRWNLLIFSRLRWKNWLGWIGFVSLFAISFPVFHFVLALESTAAAQPGTPG
jgi:hypothetical protein